MQSLVSDKNIEEGGKSDIPKRIGIASTEREGGRYLQTHRDGMTIDARMAEARSVASPVSVMAIETGIDSPPVTVFELQGNA